MPKRALARASQVVVNFEQQDADGLAELISQRFAPVTIVPLRSADRFTMSGSYGSVAGIDFSRSRVTGEFKLTPQYQYDGVFFFFPTAGSLVFHQRRGTFASMPTIAVAAEGTACRSMEFLDNHEFCGLVISRAVLAERLSVLFGRPVVEKLTFETSIDMTSSEAIALRSLVTCVTGSEFGVQLNRSPFTAERVQEALVDMVIETWPNNYSEILRRPPTMIAPRHVKLAVDFIHDHAAMLPSGTELASLSGVSLRALQAGFRRFVGVSIAAYQRQLRLERARADLLRNPAASVEEVALRWGFTNTGRFSRYFREAYGVFPTQIIRRKV
ncbi:AraC family transcriptional regulator [Bradyrhizobium ganzhouense]|uniref:AraC family transcriptional regulator n=1 Tax=Bradyrhizobium ganzhouense TaxID=1179767 RepID=UPI003CE833F3